MNPSADTSFILTDTAASRLNHNPLLTEPFPIEDSRHRGKQNAQSEKAIHSTILDDLSFVDGTSVQIVNQHIGRRGSFSEDGSMDSFITADSPAAADSPFAADKDILIDNLESFARAKTSEIDQKISELQRITSIHANSLHLLPSPFTLPLEKSRDILTQLKKLFVPPTQPNTSESKLWGGVQQDLQIKIEAEGDLKHPQFELGSSMKSVIENLSLQLDQSEKAAEVYQQLLRDKDAKIEQLERDFSDFRVNSAQSDEVFAFVIFN